jgi:acyl-lipid omega-6 desaturase (Delta-12 desaturase)
VNRNATSASAEEIKKSLANWPARLQSYARADNRKAAWEVIVTFGPYLGLWALMYFSLSWSYLLFGLLAIINGFLLVKIFTIQHDCGHRSFFRDQRLNRVVGYVCSFFSTIPFKYWAKEHDFHHAHNGQLETREIGDIALMTVEEYRQASWWKRTFYRVYRIPFCTFIIGPIVYLLMNNRLPLVKLPGWKRFHTIMTLENLAILTVYIGLGRLLGWQRFFIVQLTCVALFAIIAIWFFYVQHQHEFSYKAWKDNWDYLLSAIRGSTYYKLPRVFHWLTGNIGYHHIHHLNSKIPSYNLAKCAEENPVLQKYVTSITFRESLQCMFNKLWCEETERMITFREFYTRERSRVAA